MGGLTQERANGLLIKGGWWLLVTHAIGMIVVFVLWWMELISERVIDITTNALSWEASILTALGILITAYTKRDVNETGD
jgi:hypothetical protein